MGAGMAAAWCVQGTPKAGGCTPPFQSVTGQSINNSGEQAGLLCNSHTDCERGTAYAESWAPLLQPVPDQSTNGGSKLSSTESEPFVLV